MGAVDIGLAGALRGEHDPLSIEGEGGGILGLAVGEEGALVLAIGVGEEEADFRDSIAVEENTVFGGRLGGERRQGKQEQTGCLSHESQLYHRGGGGHWRGTALISVSDP